MNQGTQSSSDNEASQSSEELKHIRETINMLYLAVCQIEATMSDANGSVDTLTRSFTTLAEHTHDMSNKVQSVDEATELATIKSDISSTANEIQSNISQSIQAFQFYDRVCQRVDHVARSLEKVTHLLNDQNSLNNDDAWKTLQNTIKSSYTMEAERIMFEFIMRGGSVAEALEIYRHHFEKNQDSEDDDDEIELF